MSVESTVFVVDDDPAIRMALRLLLESDGLCCECYASAEELLTASKSLKCGCLVLDLRLPGMSGRELQQELRRRKIEIPIILISGDGEDSSIGDAAEFFQKPIDPAVLLSRIRELIEENHQTRCT
ncbi:MAG: response regulator [Planctomycetes bacterium]|nr:response regulator [Planctomycetota bacterium]